MNKEYVVISEVTTISGVDDKLSEILNAHQDLEYVDSHVTPKFYTGQYSGHIQHDGYHVTVIFTRPNKKKEHNID